MKEGTDVKTHEDLQDLVSNIILAQDDDFNKIDIVNAIEPRLVNSAYATGSTEATTTALMIIKTLMILEELRCLSFQKGRYRFAWN